MDETPEIRRALPGEAPLLSALALRSKAHWGYDAAFLDACREELTLSSGQVLRHDVFVAVAANVVMGFYLLKSSSSDGSTVELDMLYVEPSAIGRGIGRALFEHAVSVARRRGARRLEIEADPNAAGFYRVMGATYAGERSSGSIPDRRLPLLALDL